MEKERVRLTERMAARNIQADSATPETPIDMGKNRPYHKIDEYHTFEPSLNHWEPDMRHEWKEDKHDEVGFGIPKLAQVYIAAKKATKLAMITLGENAPEDKLEALARSYMRMGNKALDASLDIWAECKGEDCEQEETVAEETQEAPVAPEETAPADAISAPPAPAGEAVTVEAPAAPAEEEAAPAAPAEEKQEVADDPAEEAIPEIDENGNIEVDDELIATDVNFDDDEPANDSEADTDLTACFADDEEEEVAPLTESTTASKKTGIKKLAGQPTLVRVASKSADDLTGIWDKWSNPDVR